MRIQSVAPSCEPWLLSLLLLLASAYPLCSETVAPGEPPPLKRFEAGPTLFDLRSACIGTRSCGYPSFALGGDLALNLTSHWSLDTDVAATPAHSSQADDSKGGHATVALAGGRFMLRSRHLAFFVKGEAGAFLWSRSISGANLTPRGITFSFSPRAQPAYLYAGGIEYAPSRYLHLRGEVGGLTLQDVGPSATNHLHTSIGVYAPLGPTLAWKPPPLSDPRTNPFWTRTTVALLGATLLSAAADGITTQRFLRRGMQEGDPIARPLVKYGPIGQATSTLLEISAETAAMYALHRMHHSVVERTLPASTAAAHAVLAYLNLNIHYAPLP